MISLLNLLRLVFAFLLFLPLYLINKNQAVFYFLKFCGPSFVKLGQILSVRSDLVGSSMALALSSFQDKLPAFSNRELRKILRQEFGEDFTKIFADFDFVAVASASIAQVHKAKLLDGKFIAVKILRPRIARVMARDISSLFLFAKIVKIFSKNLAKDLENIADLLCQTAKSELDLLREAANAQRLRDELVGVCGFYVPRVFTKISTQKILVLEWLDGIPFSNKNEILRTDFDKRQIAQNLVISYFTQVYGNGFFHADMHPGNLFLLKNGDIGVVDFGIMGKIDKKTRLAVAEILIGFLHKDYKKVAQIHVDAGFVPSQTDIDEMAICLKKIGETVVDADVKDISLAKLLSLLVEMTRQYEMATKPELLLLQKTLLLVEGVGVMLDPKLNMWELARPWIADWAKKNLGFDAKIRDALQNLFDLARGWLKATSR